MVKLNINWKQVHHDYSKGESIDELAIKYNCFYQTINRNFKLLGFKKRTKSESAKLVKKKCGERSNNWKGGFIKRHGHLYIRTDKKYKPYHVYLWEENNGKVPFNHVIHHIDFDKLNNDLSNLKLMKFSEHVKLHNIARGKKNTEKFLAFLEKRNKMKKTTMGIILAMLVICSVNVFAGLREVECGKGYLGSYCQDFELQDEFDELAHRDNLQDDRMDVIEYDVEELDESLKWNFMMDGIHSMDIINNNIEIKETQAMIDVNDAKWSEDSSGTSFKRVLKYLNEDYLILLQKMFISAEEAHSRMDRLEARILVLENSNTFYEERVQVNLDCIQAKVESARTGVISTVNGVTFSPENPELGCMKFE